ncbi:MAG: ATP-binding protein, partial [Kiritimatiellales bacterium]
DLGGRREANYQHVPPGHYRFELLAANRDGVWNMEPVSIHILVQPHFWETWWFHAAIIVFCTLLLSFIVFSISDRIHRKKVIHAQQLQAVEEERTRIAMDIHDEIGSEVTRITLLCNLFIHTFRVKDWSKAPRHLNELDRVSQKLVKSLDEIVWVVRPSNDNLKSLLLYLSEYAVTLLEEAGIECDVDIPEVLPEINVSGPVRHNLYLAVKEALNNCIKHANATCVHLGVEIGTHIFTIVIEDNGCGIDHINGPFKRGMISMERRMALIGGRFSVECGGSGGTAVIFTVPIERPKE